jgi:hypothetical protein
MSMQHLKIKLRLQLVTAKHAHEDSTGLRSYISMLCKAYADVLLINNGSEVNVTAMQSRLKESLLTGVERSKRYFEDLLKAEAKDEKTNQKRKARDPRKKAT